MPGPSGPVAVTLQVPRAPDSLPPSGLSSWTFLTGDTSLHALCQPHARSYVTSASGASWRGVSLPGPASPHLIDEVSASGGTGRAVPSRRLVFPVLLMKYEERPPEGERRAVAEETQGAGRGLGRRGRGVDHGSLRWQGPWAEVGHTPYSQSPRHTGACALASPSPASQRCA